MTGDGDDTYDAWSQLFLSLHAMHGQDPPSALSATKSAVENPIPGAEGPERLAKLFGALVKSYPFAIERSPRHDEYDGAELELPGYMQAAAERSREERKKRLASLREAEKSIDRATSELQRLHSLRFKKAVRIRAPFIGPPDVADHRPASGAGVYGLSSTTRSRPPLTAMLARNEEAISFYLTLIFSAHCLGSGRDRSLTERIDGAGVSLAVLQGLSHLRAKTAQHRLRRLFLALERHGLVQIPSGSPSGKNRSYGRTLLLKDDASGAPYFAPRRGEDLWGSISLPARFFLNGWHLVLRPSEIATLLVLKHAEQNGLGDDTRYVRGIDGVPTGELPLRVFHKLRSERYGISRGAYGSHRELSEFGLVRRGRPRGEGYRGRARHLRTHAHPDELKSSRLPQGFWFLLNDPGFDQPAYDHVYEILSAGLEAPHLRLRDESTNFWVSRLAHQDEDYEWDGEADGENRFTDREEENSFFGEIDERLIKDIETYDHETPFYPPLAAEEEPQLQLFETAVDAPVPPFQTRHQLSNTFETIVFDGDTVVVEFDASSNERFNNALEANRFYRDLEEYLLSLPDPS